MNTDQNLKNIAEKCKVYVGAAVDSAHLNHDEEYRNFIPQQFNIITPENALKFVDTHPNRDHYDFNDADTIMSFAQAHNIKVRGHTLVWHKSLPDWIRQGQFTKEELRNMLHEHIKTIVGRYKDKIFAWDVVNEPLNDQGELENSFWLQALGSNYIETALQWAHEVDPSAQLFMNEWGAETINKKSDALYKLAKKLLKNHVPLHGIGLQMHVALGGSEMAEDVPPLNDFRTNLQRFSDLGLKIHITEMDVQIHGLKQSKKEKYEAQAKVYGDILKTALNVENFEALVMWGVTDKYSWIPEFTGHQDTPLIFDHSYKPKPAYFSMVKALQIENHPKP